MRPIRLIRPIGPIKGMRLRDVMIWRLYELFKGSKNWEIAEEDGDDKVI